MVNLAAVQSSKGFCVLVALLSASKFHPLLPFLFLFLAAAAVGQESQEEQQLRCCIVCSFWLFG